jgi:hypothetical protein
MPDSEVEIDVPRDRAGTFEPKIVNKRQRRLGEVDEMVLSLYAKGLTTGEISAHFAEIYDASISKETISRITDKVVAEMTEWSSRPLDDVYVAAHGHPARIQADDHVREATEPAFALGHQHRRERARPIPRDVQLDRTDLGLHRLRRRAVPRIAGAFPGRVVLVITQMLTELGLQTPLQDRLAQLGQETARPG